MASGGWRIYGRCRFCRVVVCAREVRDMMGGGELLFWIVVAGVIATLAAVGIVNLL